MVQSSAAGRERFSLHVLQVGAFAVVLAALPYKVFDLDRFFVPKELTLPVVALVAAVACAAGVRRVALTAVDAWLAAFLLLSAASSVLAPNWWIAGRALAISASGLMLFWVAARL